MSGAGRAVVDAAGDGELANAPGEGFLEIEISFCPGKDDDLIDFYQRLSSVTPQHAKLVFIALMESTRAAGWIRMEAVLEVRQEGSVHEGKDAPAGTSRIRFQVPGAHYPELIECWHSIPKRNRSRLFITFLRSAYLRHYRDGEPLPIAALPLQARQQVHASLPAGVREASGAGAPRETARQAHDGAWVADDSADPLEEDDFLAGILGNGAEV